MMQQIEVTKINTNNAWGFGGWSGTRTRYDNGITFEQGRNSHRHTGTSAHNYVYVNVDEDFSITVTHGNRVVLATLPTADVHIYRNNDSYHAMVGPCLNFETLFGYLPENPELFKIVKI